MPVCLDLSALKQPSRSDETASFQLMVLDQANVGSVSCTSDICSRRLKGACRTESGYHCYAVVAGGKIIGDIWCASPRNIQCRPLHPDLEWLGIQCGENEAYLFDMYVTPESRGKVVAGYLLSGALNHLKEQGFERVYGFYEKNNLPALWTHRLFGYRELPNRKISRLLLYRKSEVLPPAG